VIPARISHRVSKYSVVAAGLLFATLIATAQTPTPILERRVTVGNRTIRTSLFSNHVAVVSVRHGDEKAALQQRTLELDEYMGYLMAFERDAKELVNDRLSLRSMGGHGEITLHVGPDAPRTIEYSPLSVLDLPMSRLLAAIDDLERRVIWSDPSPAELGDWDPKRGDLVELRSGAMAIVIDVGDDGSLTLEHDDTWIMEIVPSVHRAAVILRVVEERE
jgi:hypothetical protein